MKKTMRAAQVPQASGPLQVVDVAIPEPGPGAVRIKVKACGVCHSDVFTKEGLFPGMAFPRVPGHEVVGVVDALGDGVKGWTLGQRVGVGWHGGQCGYCSSCRRGDFFDCKNGVPVTGIHYDGGYAEFMVASAGALAALPDAISDVDAAPLLCAGVTTYNALRNTDARPGDVVAVLGLGGLGHLGVQYAAKMGFHTVAIARGQDKAALARQLGAHHYIDSTTQDPAAELQKLGGARVILATVTNGDAMNAAMGGLGPNGTFMVLGAAESVSAPPMLLISGRRSIKGWYSGTAIDSEETMAFSALSGVQSMNEVYPLERAAEAYERMMSGKARFRVVIVTGH